MDSMIYHWLLSFEDSTWIPRLLCAVEDMLTWTPTYNTPRGWIIPVWWAPRKAVGVYKTGVCKSEVNFFFLRHLWRFGKTCFFFHCVPSAHWGVGNPGNFLGGAARPSDSHAHGRSPAWPQSHCTHAGWDQLIGIPTA